MTATYERRNVNEFPTLEECARERKNKERLKAVDERQLEIPTS